MIISDHLTKTRIKSNPQIFVKLAKSGKKRGLLNFYENWLVEMTCQVQNFKIHNICKFSAKTASKNIKIQTNGDRVQIYILFLPTGKLQTEIWWSCEERNDSKVVENGSNDFSDFWHEVTNPQWEESDTAGFLPKIPNFEKNG